MWHGLAAAFSWGLLDNALSAAGAVVSGLTSLGMLKLAARISASCARRAARAATTQGDGEPLGRCAAWSEEGRLASGSHTRS